jgi:thioredoxin 1
MCPCKRKERLMALKKISGKELPVVTAVVDKYVLVDFSAAWCGPCRMLHPVLEQIASELAGWDFYEIDIDESQSEAAKFGVRGVPTMIVFKAGNEVDRLVGFRDKTSLVTQLQAISSQTV